MAVFKLDELQQQPLEQYAHQLGIPPQANVSDLKRELKAKVGDVVLLTVPLGTKDKPPGAGIARTALIISIVTVSLTVITALASSVSTYLSRETLVNATDQKASEVRDAWGLVKLYDIIDEASWKDDKDRPLPGIEFKAIYDAYRSAAKAVEKKLHFQDADFEEGKVKLLLNGLIERGVVGQTIDGKYTTNRIAVNTRDTLSRWKIRQAAQFVISEILTSQDGKESGKLTVGDLKKQVKARVKEMSDEDYLVAMNGLVSSGLVIIQGKPQKVWSVLHPPE
jgi:hypothetical protein